MRKLLYAVAFALCSSATATAGPLDNAKQMYIDGQYEEALTALQALHKRSPRDGNTAYYLGATLIALGRADEAVAPLKTAESRSVAEASKALAGLALNEYRPDDASSHIDKWETALRKKRNATIPDELDEMQARVLTMRNMMERVERLEIIDSLTVDSVEFFRHYRLSREAGRICSGAEAGIEGATMVFMPQTGREMFWTAVSDSTQAPALMCAGILDDGSVENSEPADIYPEAEALAFPFLMPDGVTLYFAAKSPASLGGYDIFMTRRTDDGEYLQPQNIGMPYNSPANDYLLAIDEATGTGWWATDRFAPEGKVTIYTFIPSNMRVNVEPDAPDLASRARVTSIAATQEPGKDYDALRRQLGEMTRSDGQNDRHKVDFLMAMGNGNVYHRLSDFKNPEARRAMENLLGIDDEITAITSDLESLREKYRAGNTSVERRIRGLESELDKARARRRTAANKVVRLEQSQTILR